MTARKARPSPASHTRRLLRDGRDPDRDRHEQQPGSVAAALPQISANVSQASKRIPSSAGRTMNARALRPRCLSGRLAESHPARRNPLPAITCSFPASVIRSQRARASGISLCGRVSRRAHGRGPVSMNTPRRGRSFSRVLSIAGQAAVPIHQFTRSPRPAKTTPAVVPVLRSYTRTPHAAGPGQRNS